MSSQYVTDAHAFDHAVRGLHDIATTITKAHPGKVRGDAHLIFDDVCALIEHLGKVEPFTVADRSKIAEAMLVLAFIESRTFAAQAAE